MPLFKKKIYNLSRSPKDLKASEELFVIPETKECFRSYDEYIKKVFLYSSQHWSCQFTGKSNLTYNDALSSEKEALKQLESIPEYFKEPLLKCIHKAEGNVKDVVERCVKFLETHFCLKEDVFMVNPKNGKKSPGMIIEVLNSSSEKDVGIEIDDKENEGMNATKVSVWKYCIQLAGNDVILKDVSPDELKRKTKLPSKELLKMFLKYSAERLPVDGKDLWMVKDDLVKRYALPVVPKSCLGLNEQKSPLRSPLETISRRNSHNIPRQKGKKISPKNAAKDPSQRTLNFFVQTPNANTKEHSTPSKSNISKKIKGSPVVAELQICLTARSKLKEVVQKLSETSEGLSRGEGDGSNTEGNTVRSLFDDGKNVPAALSEVDEAKKNEIVIPDDNEDFISKKKNPDKEEKKCSEESQKTTDKKVNEKFGERNSKQEERGGDMIKVGKKRGLVMLDNDVKENKIVKKNALKKQKTLSQMFKANTLKSSNKLPEDQQSKTNVVSPLAREQPEERNVVIAINEKKESKGCVEKASSINDFEETIELPSLKAILEIARLPLPSPKPASVPVELRRYYGDVLMITEFVFHYGDFLRQDKELRCRPDELVSGLMMGGSKSEIFISILIGFLQVLLKDLRRKDSSIEFADLGVDLIDMTLSASTVSEVTRLYLQSCHHDSQHSSTKKRKELLTTRKLNQTILMDLNCKDIVDLDTAEKLEVLSHLLEQVLISESFNSHHQELEENRRLAWIKKTDLETEIKELSLEQKKLDEEKKAQTEIDVFLEKCSEDEKREMAVDKEQSECEQQHGDEKKNTLLGNKLESSGNDEKKDENVRDSNLTKRQEMAAKSKVEKEKFEEMRRFGEQVYQKRQKIERCKETINQVRECRRLESLGSDRHHSRYWLLQSNPETLFVEKIASPEMNAMNSPEALAAVKENLKDGERETLSDSSWFYYNTNGEIDRLISSLCFTDENENALKQKLKMLRKHTKKLHFQKRSTELEQTKFASEEENADHLKSVKVEICDLATRITAEQMGCINELESWTEKVMSQSSLADLATSALQLGAGVKVQSLWKKLGEREEWLKEDWTQAVKESMTSSRLRFCIAMLDYCIMWDASPIHMKCKICRRGGGLLAACEKCRKGFHIFCLRPVLDDVPYEEWLCPGCSPAAEHRTRRGITVRNVPETVHEESEEEIESPEENDDYCDVCGGDGELICCDNCPKVYHKECHDPPLRNIPRGVWKCCSCQGRRPTAKKRRIEILDESEEYSDLETSQDESADDSSYSLTDSEASEAEEAAVIRRDERAKRREQMRAKEEAKIDSQKEKARRSSKKRKRSTSPANVCDVVKRKPRQYSEFKICESLLKDLTRHEDCWPFTDPVDISEVPDYLEVVSCPMDFGTIKKKLNAFEYSNYEECISDIKLVFANSDQYNLSTSDHGLAGISLQAYFKEILPSYFPKYELLKLSKKSSRLTRSRKRSR